MEAEGTIYAIILIAAYFLPSIVAFSRGHHNAVAITILNLFLGWTFLGWVIALVWSATAVPSNMKTETQSVREPARRTSLSSTLVPILLAVLIVAGIAAALYVADYGWTLEPALDFFDAR